MNTHEKLNYVKYNLKDTQAAVFMFEILSKEESEDLPLVAAAIIQKLANKTHNLPTTFTDKLEFKDILKAFQRGLPKLETRQVVDTLYSLGKLPVPDQKYFEYILGDCLKEV